MDDVICKHEKEPIIESLIHWFNESHSIKDLDTTIIEISPLEGFKPLGIFQDTSPWMLQTIPKMLPGSNYIYKLLILFY